MKILGLDLSCNCCGWAITEDKKIVDMGFIDISNAESYKEKAELIIARMIGRTFEKIIIEESLFGFAGGGTSQQVIIKLVKNKAVIGYILENHYNIKVESIHASTARKKALGAARIKGVKPKVYVKSMIEKMFDPRPYIIYGKRTQKPVKETEDMYDALVLSLAG
jgi:hypothetical protein